MISNSAPLYENKDEGLFQAFVKASGVRMDQVTPYMTVGELGYLAIYNNKITEWLESMGYGLDRAKELPPEESETWIIWEYLDSVTKKENRAQGSNLTDKHMAILALYADTVVVDKRVKEGFRRLERAYPVLARRFGQIEKISNYSELSGL